MTREDVEVAGVHHGNQVGLYELGNSATLITADVDDLLEDPDASRSRE